MRLVFLDVLLLVKGLKAIKVWCYYCFPVNYLLQLCKAYNVSSKVDVDMLNAIKSVLADRHTDGLGQTMTSIQSHFRV